MQNDIFQFTPYEGTFGSHHTAPPQDRLITPPPEEPRTHLQTRRPRPSLASLNTFRPYQPRNQYHQQLPTPPASPSYHPASSNYHRGARPKHGRAPTPPYDDPATYLDPGHRLQLLNTLGSGAYGVVHLAKDVITGIPYAVKVLKKFNANGMPLDVRQQQFQHTEMRLHHMVSAHPNIVSLLRILDAPDSTYVVMEFCSEGDLFASIVERGHYVRNDLAAKNIFLQILDAVSHCHSLGVYHRDLKPENILVTDAGRQVKLADFGLATMDPYSTDFGCGSTFYMSPECQDQSSGRAYYACAPNDIWSLGVILVNLTCGRNPWKSASAKDSTFKAFTEDRQFLKTILPLSDELNEILGMIFELDPAKRITLEDLRQRIIHCQTLTKPAEPVFLPVETVTEDYEFLEQPQSPASTDSEDGSMISDHSDNSSVPSEADSITDYESTVAIMDDDCDSAMQAVTPVETPKVWHPAMFAIPSPYDSVVQDTSAVPATTCQLPRVPVSGPLSRPRRTRQTPASRCVAAGQFSLRPFFPDQRAVFQRAF